MITILNTTSPTGYEISIYRIYPFYFWFFLGITYCAGVFLLVQQAFAEKEIVNKVNWIAGIFIIIVTIIIILFLPILRGYIFYGRADALSHLGEINYIILNGSISNDNFYPMLHILTTSIKYLTNLNLNLIIMSIHPLLSIFYIISVYLLAKKIAKNFNQALLIIAFSSILLFGHLHLSFTPNGTSFLLTPFILLLYLRKEESKSWVNTIPLLIMIIFMPFSHPLTAIILIIIFINIYISKLIYIKYNKSKVKLSNLWIKSPLRIVKIMLIIFFTWFMLFSIFTRKLTLLANLLKEKNTMTMTTQYLEIVKENLSYYDIFEIIFRTNGHQLLYILLTIILIIIYIIYNKPHKYSQIMEFEKPNDLTQCLNLLSVDKVALNLTIYSIQFCIFTILLLSLLIFSQLDINYNRILLFVVFFSTILNGYILYEILENKSNETRKYAIVVVLFILFFSIFIGITNIYTSPTIKGYNHQVTNMELTGFDWLFKYRNTNIFIINDGVAIGQSWFANAILGPESDLKANMRKGLETRPPDHFGYTQNKTLGSSYPDNRYLITNKLAEIYYEENWAKSPFFYFSFEDFSMLSNDKSIALLYENGEFKLWKVN
ncbi:MAG: hypothetical protein Q7J35_00740 [Candidatus Methanoperedens sp.]|nr:hypothetical protein [Candidatus Methanoperedens sp.]